MATIHVSQLPLLARCNGALSLEGPSVRYDDDSAGVGKAVHAAAAAIVNGQEPPEGSPYIGTLKAMWAELWPTMPGATAAEAGMRKDFGDFHVVGKADVLSLGANENCIIDWYAGQQAPDKEQQGKGYAWVALDDKVPVRFIEVNVPDASMRSWVWTAAELDAWAAELFYNLSRPPSFTTGSHCRWCPKFTACPAHSALMRKVAADLAIVGRVDSLPREAKGQLWPALQLVATMVAAAQESIKADVIANGPISLDAEHELRASHVTTEDIEPLAAWPLLTERFTAEELAPAMKLKKGALESLASSKAGRGQKGEAKKELVEALRAAGAVLTSGYDKVLRTRKDSGHDEEN